MWRDDGICVGRWTGVPCTCVASISDKAGCAVSPAAVAGLELWACFRCIRGIRSGIPGAMVGPALQNSEFRLQSLVLRWCSLCNVFFSRILARFQYQNRWQPIIPLPIYSKRKRTSLSLPYTENFSHSYRLLYHEACMGSLPVRLRNVALRLLACTSNNTHLTRPMRYSRSRCRSFRVHMCQSLLFLLPSPILT